MGRFFISCLAGLYSLPSHPRPVSFSGRKLGSFGSCLVRRRSLSATPDQYCYPFIIGRFYLRAVRRKAFSLGRRGTAAKRWWMWGAVFPTSVICSCFANASFSPGRSLVCPVSLPGSYGNVIKLRTLSFRPSRRRVEKSVPFGLWRNGSFDVASLRSR